MLRIYALPLIVASIVQAALSTPSLASCGDWLAHRSGESKATANANGPHVDESDFVDLPAQPPCRGPACRQLPPHSPPPSIPRVDMTGKEISFLSAANFRPFPDMSVVADVVDKQPSSGFVLRIERPPRS